MNDIVKIENQSEIINLESAEIQLIINNVKDPLNLDIIYKHLVDLKDNCKATFKGHVDSEYLPDNTLEIRIGLIFETKFIASMYNILNSDVARNNEVIKMLENTNSMSSISDKLILDEVERLTKLNEDLDKKIRVVKMQLFNAMNKRDSVVDDICDYIKLVTPESNITYNNKTLELEKAFTDMRAIHNNIDINI